MKKAIIIIFMIMFVTGCSNIECPKDSKKVNNKCLIFHYKIPEEKPTCSTDYELIDNKCVKTEKRKAEYINTCPNDYTLENNSCIKVESTNFIVTNSCSSYYSLLIYGKCYNPLNITFKKNIYLCALNGNLESDYCMYVRNNAGMNVYNCPTKFSSYWCTKDESMWLSTYYYGCDYDTFGGHEVEWNGVCYNSIYSVPPAITYVCPDGFTKSSSGTNCTRTLSANVKTTYSCNSGEELNGSECVTRTETDTTLTSVCTEGYELIEQQCMLAEEVSPIKK